MLMVIFGAGASYDSSPDLPPPLPRSAEQSASQALTYVDSQEPWRLPLTNDLFLDDNQKFGDIVVRYPRLHGILSFLRRPQNGRAVEQQLEFYLDQASADQERKRQLFPSAITSTNCSAWYPTSGSNAPTASPTMLRSSTRFGARNTAGEPVCLVSFNYDLLLDRAVFPSGNTQPLERHFEGHAMFKLFKPHGSVGLARFVAGPKGTRYVEVESYDAAQLMPCMIKPLPTLKRLLRSLR